MGFDFTFEIINDSFELFDLFCECFYLIDVILFESFSTIISVVDMRLLFAIA